MTLTESRNQLSSDDPDNGIRVSELPDDANGAAAGVFEAVLSAYFRQGHEAGYKRAANDILASIVPIAEEFLRAQSAPSQELRRFVYTFTEAVERHVADLSAAGHYVEGGLGI